MGRRDSRVCCLWQADVAADKTRDLVESLHPMRLQRSAVENAKPSDWESELGSWGMWPVRRGLSVLSVQVSLLRFVSDVCFRHLKP